MNIRLAQDDDLAHILSINANDNPHAWAEHHFQAALQNKQIHVAEYEQNIIAFAIWQSVLDEAELHLVLTRKDYRKQGFAEKLLQDFISTNPQIKRFLLEVRKSNIAAQKLYEKLGFNVIAKRKDYYLLPIEDALIMEKIC